jgi:nucleotide-binding universal stress UspA family protein
MYKKILAPLDGSERAERILPHVEELARLLDAEVVFLRVVDCPPVVSGIVGSHYDEEQCHKEFERHRDEGTAYLERWCRAFGEKGISTHTRLADGPVVGAILDAAEAEGADLIALTSHGRTGLSRVFYGSVAAGILHRADRPLLMIRAEGHPH